MAVGAFLPSSPPIISKTRGSGLGRIS
jgi:hypothetical protein